MKRIDISKVLRGGGNTFSYSCKTFQAINNDLYVNAAAAVTVGMICKTN